MSEREGGREVRAFSPCFPSFAETSLEVEFRFSFGNWKYFQISQRVHLYFCFLECSVCIVFLLGTVQLQFIFLTFILVFSDY